jgi:hypothetical protein
MLTEQPRLTQGRAATNYICGRPGAPGAPVCLNEIQAAGIDQAWAGPHNSYGWSEEGGLDSPDNRGHRDVSKITLTG